MNIDSSAVIIAVITSSTGKLVEFMLPQIPRLAALIAKVSKRYFKIIALFWDVLIVFMGVVFLVMQFWRAAPATTRDTVSAPVWLFLVFHHGNQFGARLRARREKQ